MADIFDYIKTYGDFSFAEVEFNPLDGLIFSRLSYLPFESTNFDFPDTEASSVQQKTKCRSGSTEFSLTKAAAYFAFCRDVYSIIEMPYREYGDDIRLLINASKANRYRDILISFYENNFDLEQRKQFAAVTFLFEREPAYVAFRGTDVSVIGWEENFTMSFETPIPSQKEAVSYLTKIAKVLKSPLRIGGHSKGGNLAVYAAAFCSKSVQKRILSIHNYDGPGFDFDAEILSSKEYTSIQEKIQTFVPQASIIGMLLDHTENYIIVQSSQSDGIMQHDVYSWETEANVFLQIEDMTRGSKIVGTILSQWIRSLSFSQRKEFIAVICKLLDATNMKTFPDIVKTLPASMLLASIAWLKLEAALRQRFWKVCKIFLSSLQMEISRETIKDIRAIIQSWLEVNHIPNSHSLIGRLQSELLKIVKKVEEKGLETRD
jgi:hypothetical protein